MFSGKLLIPLVVIGGGALIFTSAKAAAKKKKVEEAYDLGLDTPDEGEQPPIPPAVERAVPQNLINASLFQAWWQQTQYGEAGVPGFWIKEFQDPPSGLDWIGPFPFLQLDINPNVAIATNDGALWYWDNGWHPAPLLASDYDAWYEATH